MERTGWRCIGDKGGIAGLWLCQGTKSWLLGNRWHQESKLWKTGKEQKLVVIQEVRRICKRLALKRQGTFVALCKRPGIEPLVPNAERTWRKEEYKIWVHNYCYRQWWKLWTLCLLHCLDLSFKIGIWVNRQSEIKCSVCDVRESLECSRNVRMYYFLLPRQNLEANNLREENIISTCFQKRQVIMVSQEHIGEFSQWQKQGKENIVELQMGVISNPIDLCPLGFLSQRSHNLLEHSY